VPAELTAPAAEGVRRTFGEWAVEHGEIIGALIRRELKSRFSHNFFGYSWTFAAPAVWIAVTYAMFYFVGRKSPVYTDVITFILSGLIPYVSFRYVINSMGRVAAAARPLLIFPTITLEHAAIAGALVEFGNMLVLAAVMMAVNYVAFGNFELDNFPMWIEGVALAWLLGAAYGYFFVVISRNDPTLFQLGVVILRPSYFISAVFFVPNELRGDILSVFTWNPLMHAIEIARDGMLFHYTSHVADPGYVVACIVGMFAAALAVRVWRGE
jgi:capsular polysaccharide transport system permease protein